MNKPIIFILSWQRPLYLWACLDSLYHNTVVPRRFVLIDNASSDPLVHKIIAAYEARGLFHAVHRRSHNSPEALAEALRDHRHEVGEHFAFVESDVMILPGEPDWLTEFMSLAAADPKLAVIGSLVDKRDFVDPALAAMRFPQLSQTELDFLIKIKSPERQLQDSYTERLIQPFNPPGRLLYLRTDFIDEVGILRDRLLYAACKRLGYAGGISTRVRHRHLSFQNIYDYPELDIGKRNAFFDALEVEKKL